MFNLPRAASYVNLDKSNGKQAVQDSSNNCGMVYRYFGYADLICWMSGMVKESRTKTQDQWEVNQNTKKTATRQLRKVAT